MPQILKPQSKFNPQPKNMHPHVIPNSELGTPPSCCSCFTSSKLNPKRWIIPMEYKMILVAKKENAKSELTVSRTLFCSTSPLLQTLSPRFPPLPDTLKNHLQFKKIVLASPTINQPKGKGITPYVPLIAEHEAKTK